MITRPLRSEFEQLIAELKRAYTVACADLIANKPNAAARAQIACRQLAEARRQIAQLDESQPAMEER